MMVLRGQDANDIQKFIEHQISSLTLLLTACNWWVSGSNQITTLTNAARHCMSRDSCWRDQRREKPSHRPKPIQCRWWSFETAHHLLADGQTICQSCPMSSTLTPRFCVQECTSACFKTRWSELWGNQLLPSALLPNTNIRIKFWSSQRSRLRETDGACHVASHPTILLFPTTSEEIWRQCDADTPWSWQDASTFDWKWFDPELITCAKWGGLQGYLLLNRSCRTIQD